MQNFISFPTIESGIYMFGGHRHTVNGNWSFFEKSHQVFELMVIVDGHQITEIRNRTPIDLGPGEAIIIAPGTYHINYNASKTNKMTYMCLHFDFEDAQIRSQIIGMITNRVFSADSALAKLSMEMLNEVVGFSEDRSQQNEFDTQVKIEIALLTYLQKINKLMGEFDGKQNMPYTDKEAKIGRDIAMTIENHINNDDQDPAFSFNDICKELAIGCGYGHRVFKKVYGITPLHFIDREKYRKAQRLLEYSGNSIEEIAYQIGAANISIFSKQFKKWSGSSPSLYRKQVGQQRHVISKNQTGYFE